MRRLPPVLAALLPWLGACAGTPSEPPYDPRYREIPLAAAAALPFLVFLVETGWYVIVAVALSAPRSRDAYLHSKRWVDRAAGTMMGLLGVKLLTSD